MSMLIDASRIRAERVVRGFTQTALARKVRRCPATISNLENGKGVGPKTLKRIADVLGIPMEEILCRENESANKSA